MDSSSGRNYSAKDEKTTNSARQRQSTRRSSAGEKATSGATTPQPDSPASPPGQQPSNDLTASTSQHPPETPASGRLTPDWFHDKRWATLLTLESTFLSPSTLRPHSLPPTAQQSQATVQAAPRVIRVGESTGAAFQESHALLPSTPLVGKHVLLGTATVDEASSWSAERHAEPTSVEAGEQLTIHHSDSQQANTEAATMAAQPSARSCTEDTPSRSQDGTGAGTTWPASRAARPSTLTEFLGVTSRDPDGEATELARDSLSGSQPSATARPPQTASMRHETTDAEIRKVIGPITLSSRSASLTDTTPKSPDGTNVEVGRTATLNTPSSVSSSILETMQRSQEGADDVGATSAPKGVLKTALPSLVSIVKTPSGAPSVLFSLSQTTPPSSGGKARVARKRRISEGDSNASQRGSEALTISRSTPSLVRYLEDGAASVSYGVDSSQGLPTPLDGRKRRRLQSSETGIPPDRYLTKLVRARARCNWCR
ncbi:hypothetical protein MRX96_045894 [Rhipicephalus microplus]